MNAPLGIVKKTEDSLIYSIRGHKVMLDKDLATLYGVQTKVLNQAVKRNAARFPEEFMFQLNDVEADFLRSQIVTSKKETRGGRQYNPYVFTEHGTVMLASVLNSPEAVHASIQVVKAFVRLREMLIANKELAQKLNALEGKYDKQFAVVFDAIRKLMSPSNSPSPRKKIGYKRSMEE